MATNVEIFGRNYNNGQTIAIKTDGSGSLTTILEGLNGGGTEVNQIVVNDDGSINVVGGGGGGGGGIVQGANIDDGLGINISADTRVENTETINRLYTHSSLYAQYTDGFGGKRDLPLNTDETGKLNVNVVGGDTFDGVIKGISTGVGNPAVSFSADVITLIGGNSIKKLYTHSSVYGKDAVSEQEKQIDVNTDGYVSVDVKNTSIDSHIYGSSDGTTWHHIKTNTNGVVSTNAIIQDVNGDDLTSTLIGDKQSLDVNVANTTAIPVSGTFYQTTQPVSIASSVAVTSSTLATQETLSALNNKINNDPNLYPHSIKTVVDNNIINSPIVQSQRFDVVINNYLYGDSTGNNTPPFGRSITGNQGWYYINTDPLKSSNVYYYTNIPNLPITRQTDVFLTNINFFYAVVVLNYVGTDIKNLPFLVMGSQPVGVDDHIPNFANTVYTYTLPALVGSTYLAGEPIVIYFSQDVNKKPLETFMPNLRRFKCNLSTTSGPITSDKLGYFSINTQTAVTEKQEYTLIGAGYKFDLAGGQQGGDINSSSVVFDFEFTAKTVIENNLAKLTFDETNQLLVNTGGAVVVSGSYGNIANNITLFTSGDTTPFNLSNGNYKKDCILTVNDSSITSTGFYIIIASSDGGNNYENLGLIQPFSSITGNRGNSTTLNLTPYNRIALINGSGDTYENVIISLYSS